MAEQVVVALKITTDAQTGGIKVTTGSLEDMGKAASKAGSEWDKLGNTIQKKFSAGDIGKSVLGGLGLGSGFAVAQQTASVLIGFWQRSAELAKYVADQSERAAAAVERRLSRDRSALQNLSALRQRQAAEEKQLQELSTPRYETQTVGNNWRGQDTTREARVRIALTAEETKQQRDLEVSTKERADAIRELELAIKGSADAVRAQVSEDAKYAQQVKEVNDLVGPNGLSRAEADARIQQLNQERQEKASKTASDRVAAQLAEDEKIQAAKQKLTSLLTEAATKYRELADPQFKYKQQLAEIDGLMRTYSADGKPFLSAQDAAAAKARILAEMNDTAGKAIRAARDEVEAYDVALERLEANPALSDQEKQRERIRLINEQTAAIERAKEALQAFMAANPGVDVGGLTSALQSLGDKSSRNAGLGQPAQTLAQRDAIGTRDLGDPAKHYQSAGDGFMGGIQQHLAAVGTLGDQVADGIRNTLGSAVQGITGEIMKWDGTARGALSVIGGIGRVVFQAMLQQIVQMGVQWLINQALIKTGLITIEATGDALRAGRVAKENAAEAATLPMKTAGAAASGISSWGATLAFGALAVALIASLASGFAEGGYTDKGPTNKPAGIVHAGEWVAPQWMVSDERWAPVIATLEAARNGAPGYALGGLVKLLGRGMPRWAQDPINRWVSDRFNLADGTALYGRQVDAWDFSGAADQLAAVSDNISRQLPAAEEAARRSRNTVAESSPSAGGGRGNTYLLLDRAEFARMMQEDSAGWFEDMSARRERRQG